MQPDRAMGFGGGDVFPDFEEERRLRRHGPLGRRPEARLRRDAGGIVAEELEGRCFLSVTPSHDTTANVLTLTGNGDADRIAIWQNNGAPDEIVVEVNDVELDRWDVDENLTKVKVFAGAGNDTVFAASSDYGLLGGESLTVLVEMYGQDGDDELDGSDGPDTMDGGTGDDDMWGAAGNDIMYGYGGGDFMDGDGNNDIMYGCDGLNSSDGNDTMHADSGNDILYGEGGNDDLHCFSGSDAAYGGDGADYLTANAAGGQTYLGGGAGNDTFVANDTYMTSILGGSGTDSLQAADVSDTLLDTIELP